MGPGSRSLRSLVRDDVVGRISGSIVKEPFEIAIFGFAEPVIGRASRDLLAPWNDRGCTSAISRHDVPELLRRPPSKRKEGAGKAGCRPHPWSACNKNARGRTTGTGGSSGLPCAMALRLIRDLPGDRAFLPPSPARRVSVCASLAPASGRQDHTISPYAAASSSWRLRT